MANLTVFLAPSRVADGVKDVLKDLSAVGLLRTFLWVEGSILDNTPIPATRVELGREYDTTVQHVLASARIDVVRLCVFVPLSGLDPALHVDRERSLADLLTSTSGGARVVRLRLLLGRSGSTPPPGSVIALDGWHNVLIAPEDARGPGMGHVALGDDGPVELGRHTAPVVAAIAGLWSEVDHTPFDDKPILPGNLVCLTRSFYRRLDTTSVENSLRRQIFEQDGRLPLPRENGAPVTYIDDVPLATQSMADDLWTKYSSVLRGERVPYSQETAQTIGFWGALKMFFSFLGAALRNAPAAWYARLVQGVSTTVAGAVHEAVFGRNPSAYEVVVNGRTSQGRIAGWSQIGSAVHQLRGALDDDIDRRHVARSDLTDLWQDYSRAAMTLADGGARSAELAPVQIGASRGILRKASEVVPGPSQRFDGVPGVIAATVGVSEVDATDVIGIRELQNSLTDLHQDASLGLDARRTSSALDSWRTGSRNSFGVQVGTTLARHYDDRYREVRELLGRVRARSEASAPPESRGHTRLARWVQVTSVLLVLIVAASVLGVTQTWFQWWVGTLIAVGSVVLWTVILAFVFMRGQRDLFLDLHKRKTEAADSAADEANLRTALRDLDRLTDAYAQFVSWSRALGAFLAEPLGPSSFETADEHRISWGLPRNVAVGYAAPQSEEVGSTAEYLRQDLFGFGWLTPPWEKALLNAGDSLGSDGRDIGSDPDVLWRSPGSGSDSVLDRWSCSFFSGSVRSSGAEIMWEKARHNLMGPKSELISSLVGRVEVPVDETTQIDSLVDFMAGVGDDSTTDRRDHFDRAMLTDLATTQGLSEVKYDRRSRDWAGIGSVNVVTQISDGLSVDQLMIGGDQNSKASQEWNVPAFPDRRGAESSSLPVTPTDYEPPQNTGFRF